MKKITLWFLCFVMFCGILPQTYALESSSALADTAEYIYNTVEDPQVGSIGGEWAVMGLARSNADIPSEYYSRYISNAELYVKKCGGVLHSRKYTEYSRLIVALTALGENPADIAGYNLLTPLADFEKTVWQGINGAVWALIALDCGNYEIPQNTDGSISATREMYLDYILQKQLPDGGWAMSGETSDSDVTAMVLQALSKYQNDEEVQKASEAALALMSERQNPSGGFSTEGEETPESAAQMLVALCELGISVKDERFIKNGNTILDNILSYHVSGGGFSRKVGSSEINQMATEQCFYALVALSRAQNGMNTLYDMNDAVHLGSSAVGLPGKDSEINISEIIYPGKTFTDIENHASRAAIEALASRGIINGKSENEFVPNATMTRAEFAAIIVRGLGIPEKNGDIFDDVSKGDWYFGYVNTAYAYGIIKGVSDTKFNPNGTITREEAAVMTVRAAKLCGLDTELSSKEIRDILAQFSDYTTVSAWAESALAYCCKNGILPDDDIDLKPRENVVRAEIAQMLCNTLFLADLLI